MSDREKVINDLQLQIEELEERLAIVLEGQPEIVLCKDCNNRGTSDCPIEELCNGWIPSDDWFCADGERK